MYRHRHRHRTSAEHYKDGATTDGSVRPEFVRPPAARYRSVTIFRFVGSLLQDQSRVRRPHVRKTPDRSRCLRHLPFTHGSAFLARVEGDRAATATPDEITASLGELIEVEFRDCRLAQARVGDQPAAGGIRVAVPDWRYIRGHLAPRAHVNSVISVTGRACQ